VGKTKQAKCRHCGRDLSGHVTERRKHGIYFCSDVRLACIEFVKCRICERAIPEARQKRRAKTCSDECATKRVRKSYQEQNTRPRLSTSAQGALSEFRAANELLARGAHVYRSISPSAPFDLVIYYEGELYRVEVTTGHYSAAGTLFHPPKDSSKYDILAVVHDNGLYIEPERWRLEFGLGNEDVGA